MTTISLEWFADLVSRLSRQALTTMGKRIGVTPLRQHGSWHFRNAAGEDLALEEVLRKLQEHAAGQAWLTDQREYPVRSARAAQERARAQERVLMETLAESSRFLVTDFGYEAPFRIDARIEDRVILGYRNGAAARLVEVSGHADGYRTHCEIRRLLAGEPGEYGPHSVAIWELRMVREPTDHSDEPFERDAALARNAALLQRHADILRGTGWIERDRIDRVVQRKWFGRLGVSPPLRDAPSALAIARRHASVLVETHGFTLEFDSDALSPHESQMWRELGYRRGDTTIRIVNSDIRVSSEWSLQVNGRSISHMQGDFEAWLVEALRGVTRGL